MHTERRNAVLRCVHWAFPALLLGLAATRGGAALPPHTTGSPRPASAFHLTVLDSLRRIDANRINMFTTNYGSFAYDLSTGDAGLTWPKGTRQTAVFASGLWLGCRVNGQTRVAVAEYTFEYGPGSMVGGAADNPNRPEYRVYKVARWNGNPTDSAHVDRSAAELAADPGLDPLLHHSWSEYMAGAAPHGAPTRTYRLANTATPDPSDSVDIPGPDVLGDQMLWEVHNEAAAQYHVNYAGKTAPLGVEVQQTLFAYDRADAFGDVVFARFRILNKGGNTLDSLYVSLWSDPDLGGFADDLVGCDTTRSLGFTYNASAVDQVYGPDPPALGYLLLQGLANPVGGGPLGMTSFIKYIGGTDPASSQETYNYMQGLLPDGSPIINPTTGQPTPFVHPGDPVTGTGWLDSNPSDRRFMISSGPGRLLPGESRDVWAAIIVARGPDNFNSVGSVRCVADLARTAFEQGFASLPVPPVTCPLATNYHAQNCPRASDFWNAECAAGGSQLTPQQLDAVSAFVDSQSVLFDWPAGARAGFCATVNPAGPTDLRRQARREFATFLANFAGSQIDLTTSGGQRVWLNPGTSVTCPALSAITVLELAATARLSPKLLDASYLNITPDHRRAIEGVNFGLPYFGGGAGVGNDFQGSTIRPEANPDSFKTVEIRFNDTATQKCYRYLRLENPTTGVPPAPFPDRGYPFGGFYDCNFQVWDMVNNVQLDAGFVERGIMDDAGAYQDSTGFPSINRTWAPTTEAAGDREYLYIFNRPYSATPKAELMVDDAINNGALPVLYTLIAKLRDATDVIDNRDAFRFEWGRPPSPGADLLLHDLESQPLGDPAVQQTYSDLIACFSALNNGYGIDPACAFGPTPDLVSLVTSEAVAESVTVRWRSYEPGLAPGVYRMRVDVQYPYPENHGRLMADGAGDLVLNDNSVVPGASYDYWLRVQTAAGVRDLGLAHVHVPSTSALIFFSARANPGGEGILVSFSLATGDPARIELMDVTGRRMFSQTYEGLGLGRHSLVVGDGRHIPSGIYFVRIAQGNAHVTGKAAVFR